MLRACQIWAMQNEDANPNLVIIDPATQQQSLYSFAAPPAHGGGYDDIVFRNGKVYFSASNPALNPNTAPAIVAATIVGDQSYIYDHVNLGFTVQSGDDLMVVGVSLSRAEGLWASSELIMVSYRRSGPPPGTWLSVCVPPMA